MNMQQLREKYRIINSCVGKQTLSLAELLETPVIYTETRSLEDKVKEIKKAAIADIIARINLLEREECITCANGDDYYDESEYAQEICSEGNILIPLQSKKKKKKRQVK